MCLCALPQSTIPRNLHIIYKKVKASNIESNFYACHYTAHWEREKEQKCVEACSIEHRERDMNLHRKKDMCYAKIQSSCIWHMYKCYFAKLMFEDILQYTPASFEVIGGSTKCGSNFMKSIHKIIHSNLNAFLIQRFSEVIHGYLPVQSKRDSTFDNTFQLCSTVVLCPCSFIQKIVSVTIINPSGA